MSQRWNIFAFLFYYLILLWWILAILVPFLTIMMFKGFGFELTVIPGYHSDYLFPDQVWAQYFQTYMNYFSIIFSILIGPMSFYSGIQRLMKIEVGLNTKIHSLAKSIAISVAGGMFLATALFIARDIVIAIIAGGGYIGQSYLPDQITVPEKMWLCAFLTAISIALVEGSAVQFIRRWKAPQT